MINFLIKIIFILIIEKIFFIKMAHLTYICVFFKLTIVNQKKFNSKLKIIFN